MHHRSFDLFWVSGLALFGILVAWVGPKNPDQVNSLPFWFAPIGILIVLFIPGYAILAGIFPQFDSPSVILLSMGLSIATDVIGGLVLNITPWGLTPLSWAVLLGLVTFAGSLNTIFRRHTQFASGSQVQGILSSITWRDGAIFTIAVMILAISVIMTFVNILKDETAITQLWAAPATENGVYALQIGIKSQEIQATHYDLYIEESGVKLNEILDLVVLPGETWTTTLELDSHPASLIHIYLYLSGNTKDPYRMVQIAPISFNYVMTPTPTAISP